MLNIIWESRAQLGGSLFWELKNEKGNARKRGDAADSYAYAIPGRSGNVLAAHAFVGEGESPGASEKRNFNEPVSGAWRGLLSLFSSI